MINIFKSYNPYSVIILFLVTIIFKLAYIFNPELPLYSDDQLLWGLIHNSLINAFGDVPLFFTFLALINITGQALYLNKVANRHHLFPGYTYLPAMGYVLITSINPDWNYLSAQLIANWFFIAILDNTLKLYLTSEIKKQTFNIGFLIGLATLFSYFNALFLIFFIIALAVLRPFKLRELMTGVIGFITPLYFFVALLYLSGRLKLLSDLNNFTWELNYNIKSSETFFVAVSFVFLLLIVACYYLSNFMNRMVIQNRKFWWMVLLFMTISLPVVLLSSINGHQELVFLVSYTLIFTNIWFETNRKWIGNILFYLLIAVILFVQWWDYIKLIKI